MPKFADIIEQGYEVRAPSIGEWKRAHDLGMISTSPNNVEVLADSAFSNFRGAHMDGSPRLESMIGPLSSQKPDCKFILEIKTSLQQVQCLKTED